MKVSVKCHTTGHKKYLEPENKKQEVNLRGHIPCGMCGMRGKRMKFSSMDEVLGKDRAALR